MLPAYLEVSIAKCVGRSSHRIRLRSCTTVGRDSDNDISFWGSTLSRRHAEFRQRIGSYYVVDLDSTYGTYVNHTRVHGEAMLSDGDVVTVGETNFVFHVADLPDPRTISDGPGSGTVMTEIRPEQTTRTMRSVVDVTQLSREDPLLGVVCRATNALVAHTPLPEIFGRILDAVLDSIPAKRTAIMVLEGQPPVPTLKATRTRNGAGPRPLPPDIIKRAIEGREAFLLHDIPGSIYPHDGHGTNGDSPNCVMCAPLWVSQGQGESRVLGLVYLDGPMDGKPLTERDLDVLVMLASIAATKIENAWLVEQNLQKHRIEEDLRRAAEIQSSLLPCSAPIIKGYRICGATEPCRMVGGDYFDFDYDGRTLHMALADVSGKGIGAAMLMVALRATVRAHWRDGALGKAVARINRSFHQTVPPDKYATLFLARLDPAKGRLEYVNAGHNQPLLIRPNGERRLLGVGATVVGAFPEIAYRQETVEMEPGACLIVFSDGISDAWRHQAEADRQLAKLAAERTTGDAASLRAKVFRATEQTNDDRTLMIVERLPADGANRRA